jgi:hypothetical protein
MLLSNTVCARVTLDLPIIFYNIDQITAKPYFYYSRCLIINFEIFQNAHMSNVGLAFTKFIKNKLR